MLGRVSWIWGFFVWVRMGEVLVLCNVGKGCVAGCIEGCAFVCIWTLARYARRAGHLE